MPRSRFYGSAATPCTARARAITRYAASRRQCSAWRSSATSRTPAQRTSHTTPAAVDYVGVDHRGARIPVAKAVPGSSECHSHPRAGGWRTTAGACGSWRASECRRPARPRARRVGARIRADGSASAGRSRGPCRTALPGTGSARERAVCRRAPAPKEALRSGRGAAFSRQGNATVTRW